MSCPDWPALLAAREADPGRDPAGWDAARAHLRDCPDCRATAIALDPILVFARLPEPAAGPEEIERMRLAVATLRHAEVLRAGERRLARRWRRGALAAGLLLAALAQRPLEPGSAAGPATAGIAAAPLAAEFAGEGAATGLLPVVDDLDRPQARIYEMGTEGLSVVMIVDQSLDV